MWQVNYLFLFPRLMWDGFLFLENNVHRNVKMLLKLVDIWLHFKKQNNPLRKPRYDHYFSFYRRDSPSDSIPCTFPNVKCIFIQRFHYCIEFRLNTIDSEHESIAFTWTAYICLFVINFVFSCLKRNWYIACGICGLSVVSFYVSIPKSQTMVKNMHPGMFL